MTTKLIKELAIGDVVRIADPDGTARVTSKDRSRLFHASGGCWALDLKVVSGPHAGKTIPDQHHPGDDAVELA